MNGMSDMFRQRGVLAALLGAGIFIGAAGLHIYYELVESRRRRALMQHIQMLDISVSEMRLELLNLREGRRSRRSSVRSNSSRSRWNHNTGYETESDMYSALDTDDEEFFDFNSEDEEIVLRSFSEAQTNEKAEKLLKEVDSLFTGAESDKHEAHRMLKMSESELDNNPEFLWRFAKSHHIQATSNSSEDLKKQFIYDGLSYAEKALSLDVTNPDAHKWYAILVGLKGNYLSTKEKIQNGYLFQKHVTAALLNRPNDPSLHYLSGRFKYEVASLSWVEKKVAATLFAELPAASFEEALKDCEKAESLNPTPWLENRVLLAKCCIGSGDYQTAVRWLDRAKEIEPKVSDEKILAAEVESMLSKYARYRN